jgi:hypothetical protein
MDEVSLTRTAQPSTKSIVADKGLCRQVAALLLCDEEPVCDAFIGEPVEEVLEMVRWALSHGNDGGFDAAKVLTGWARKRGRGAWSARPRRLERDPYTELAQVLANYWAEHPGELTALLDQAQASLNGRS